MKAIVENNPTGRLASLGIEDITPWSKTVITKLFSLYFFHEFVSFVMFRVLSLVPSTGRVEVLMDNLYFANGIQLFEDKQSFVVAETTMARILRWVRWKNVMHALFIITIKNFWNDYK